MYVVAKRKCHKQKIIIFAFQSLKQTVIYKKQTNHIEKYYNTAKKIMPYHALLSLDMLKYGVGPWQALKFLTGISIGAYYHQKRAQCTLNKIDLVISQLLFQSNREKTHYIYL